jgi:hypothetical protein
MQGLRVAEDASFLGCVRYVILSLVTDIFEQL